MRARDLLDVPGLGLRLLTDVAGADRVITHVFTTDLPDPSRYLTPGDLVLTGMIWCREPGDADRFVRSLANAGAWVLGGTGTALPEPLAQRLAAEYLKADRLPVTARLTGPHGAAGGDGKYSLFGVGGEPRITSWFLACAGNEQDWAPEPRESIAELAADAALERARLDAGRAGDRRLAEAIVALLGSEAGEGGAPAEIASLMRAAGLAPDGSYLVAVMHVEADRMAGPNADRWRVDLAEELVIPHAEGAVAGPRGDQVVVLIPVRPRAATGPDPEAPAAGRALAAWLRDRQPVLESDRARIRLTIGISAAAGGAALVGALHEAESARRLAGLRASGPAPAAVSVVTSDEVASHELLMASVPGTVLRSFRERLLGPLLAYDERHRAELLPTLREFLACSGSWNACAARMYVHVNTVRYRIRRIEELTGRDLSSLDDQVDFFLALRIR